MEHKPFVGAGYQTGISGRKIAIVGWSHHLECDGIDDENATIDCISNVINGDWNIAFFKSIENYFEHHCSTFWPNTIFFNFLPQVVGPSSNRYGNGTEQQAARGRERFLEILRDKQPDKVFVFTSRSPRFPEPDGNEFSPIRSDLGKFYKALYSNSGYNGEVYFLRHPQGAPKDAMRSIVQHCMEAP